MKHSFLDFAFVPKIAQTEALYFRAHDFQLSEHFLLAMRKGALSALIHFLMEFPFQNCGNIRI